MVHGVDEPVEAEFFNALTKALVMTTQVVPRWSVNRKVAKMARNGLLAKQFVQGEWALSSPDPARVGLTRLPVLFAAIKWMAASIALGDQ